jgi:hypothetical protein
MHFCIYPPLLTFGNDAIAAFGLWYLVARLFPITVTAVILIFGALAYVTFGQHEISDGATKVYA